jgi:AcrR family transcriptional regulator
MNHSTTPLVALAEPVLPDLSPTAASLLGAAREIFAERGYDGSSIRAITRRAGANLGAVTYHFGSKEALYHAVIASKLAPLRARVDAAVDAPGAALDRIAAVVGALFDHYAEDPGLPRLILQQIASGRSAPPPARAWIRHLAGLLSGLVRAGQEDGTIRSGDPLFLALGVVPPAIFVHLIRRPLEESLGLSVDDPETRASMRAHVVGGARALLAADREAA